MIPKLERAFTLRGYLDLENFLRIGPVKSGPHRAIIHATSGFLEGSGVKAKVVPGGGDWLLLDPSYNVGHLDVRVQFKTEDGEGIYARYDGVLRMDEATQKILDRSEDAKDTEYGDHYFFITPIFETSSERLKWMNSTVFVGQGRWMMDKNGYAVEYGIYKMEN